MPGQSDQNSWKDLRNDVVDLFVDKYDNKHYFFADYIRDEGGDNFELIEKATCRNVEVFGEKGFSPSDAYLIMFWKVPNIDDSVYTTVIDIEENEFFYKKYVIYYTDEELKLMNDWIDNIEKKKMISVENVLLELSKKLDGKFDLAEQLMLRILTKIPFLRYKFPSAQMKDFESILTENMNKCRDGKNGKVIELKNVIDDMSGDVDSVSEQLFAKYLGGFC